MSSDKTAIKAAWRQAKKLGPLDAGEVLALASPEAAEDYCPEYVLWLRVLDMAYHYAMGHRIGSIEETVEAAMNAAEEGTEQ